MSLNKPVPKWMNYYWVSALVFIVLISWVTYVGLTKGLLAAGFLFCLVPTIGALLVGQCALCTASCPYNSLHLLQRLNNQIKQEVVLK